MTSISMVIPTIPPRARLLIRALASVAAQTRYPDEIIVPVDTEGHGAARTRQRGLDMATGEWVAFLDDDDELLPQHLARLLAHAEETGADLVFPWFHVIGGYDPFPQHFGRTWTRDDPTQTTITFLVRRAAALDAGGFVEPEDGIDGEGHRAGEDFRFVCRLADRYKVVHLGERTWRWHHHLSTPSSLGNTSGRPWTQFVAEGVTS